MLTISLVSHDHGEMVWALVDQLVKCPEVAQIIVTLNIPELTPSSLNNKIRLVRNLTPKGFGANHNSAFNFCNTPYFCVLNPDIELEDNPFEMLLSCIDAKQAGLVAPMVVGSTGLPEDSMRQFITPLSIIKRLMRLNLGLHEVNSNSAYTYPDWVAGMCMLFCAKTYSRVQGFDESYFMYCEDADICTRMWDQGYLIVGCMSVRVTHNAQRSSHRNLRYFFWHLQSLFRYFYTHSFSLPNKALVIARNLYI